MSSNLFTPSLRYTNKDTCNSAWTFIDGQNVSDIEVPIFIKNLFTSFDDSRYGKMGKDLIEGVGVGGTCSSDTECNDPNNLCKLSPEHTQPCPSEGQGQECACVLVDTGGDPCSTNPCQHGGTCTSDGSSHTCVCPTGYTGDNCEIEPSDPCSTNPCQHGGTCTSDGSSHTCVCPTGYTGDNCETEDQTTYKCSSAFEGAKTGKDQPCNLNYPASKGWTKGDLDADPLWAKYNTGKDDSSLTKDQSDAVKDLISTNSGKGPTYTPDQMDDEVWKKCCKKAECTDAGWDNISITDTAGSWPAYGSSWGCIF
jgi:hypothetical protein